MKLQIKVTEKNIRKGLSGSCLECPIALAVHQKLNKWWPFKKYHVRVDSDSVSLLNRFKKRRQPSYHLVAVLPLVAERFVKNFDFKKKDQVFDPFEFELEFM